MEGFGNMIEEVIISENFLKSKGAKCLKKFIKKNVNLKIVDFCLLYLAFNSIPFESIQSMKEKGFRKEILIIDGKIKRRKYDVLMLFIRRIKTIFITYNLIQFKTFIFNLHLIKFRNIEIFYF